MTAKTHTPATSPAPAAPAALRVNGSQVSVRAGALPTRQHRPGYIALLVVLVVGLGLLGGFLYTSAGSKATVLVLVRDVPAGQVITRGDVSTASLAGDVQAVPAGQLGVVLGRRAVVELLPGTVLQSSMLGDGPKIPPGQAQVGLQLPPGSLPAAGVLPGDAVQVWQLPPRSTAGGAGAAPVLVADATVASALPDPSRSGGFLVTVSVPAGKVAAVVAAGGAGAAVLVLVGPS